MKEQLSDRSVLFHSRGNLGMSVSNTSMALNSSGMNKTWNPMYVRKIHESLLVHLCSADWTYIGSYSLDLICR